MITFAGGFINTDVLYHENMHQWWGDNVTEGGYTMTFYKEGMATVAEELYAARLAENKAGGPYSPKGQAAFQASLVKEFNHIYAANGSFWTVAPSNPEPSGLFSGSSTYDRPSAAYLALRQILGPGNFTQALEQVQRAYGGSFITEPEWEAAFSQWLPVPTSACRARLSQFFTQWFDTAYPAGGGANRPQITGPGLNGPNFYNAQGGCS
jgi:aminopeptidase N